MSKTEANGSGCWWIGEDHAGKRPAASSYVVLCMAVALLRTPGAFGLEDGIDEGTGEGDFIESKLVALDGARGDQLGWSVEIDADVLVAGAVNAGDAGAAYVFGRAGRDWTEETILRPIGNPPNASFGNAVDADGQILVVGAPRDREDGDDVGAAYVFRQTDEQWRMEARLVAPDGVAGDRFGESVAISGDFLVVGAPSRDERGDNAGAVYVFVAANGEWNEEMRLAADGVGTGDLFGTAVAVEGRIIVVGAPSDTATVNSPGFAYVFEREAEQWVERDRLTGPGSQRDLFGISVDVDARTIVVGAPRAAPSLPVRPGGSVHVFQPVGSRWIEQARLVPPDGTSADRFGFSVSISGGTIIASAVELCSVYVFRRTGIAWREDATLAAGDGCQAGFGRAVDVWGDTILVGTPSDGERGNSAGAAYAYDTSNEEVILGPGTQIAVAGEEAELYLTFDSRAAEVASFRFDALLPAELTLDTNPADAADCRLEEDLAGDFALTATVTSNPVTLRVEVTAIADPPHALPRDGLIGRCRAHVDKEVVPGIRPLSCAEDGPPARAANVDGEPFAARCEDGELKILPPCHGDCDGSGDVSVDELLAGIRVALDLQPLDSCNALDRNLDGNASVDELVGAVSAALNGCGSEG